jgi:hypothetical protein
MFNLDQDPRQAQTDLPKPVDAEEPARVAAAATWEGYRPEILVCLDDY